MRKNFARFFIRGRFYGQTLGRSLGQIGQAMREALLFLLFVPRCLLCLEPLSVYTPYGLCKGCLELLPDNQGLRCLRCDLPLGVDLKATTAIFYYCQECRQASRHDRPFISLRAPWLYGGALLELWSLAKFRQQEGVALALSRLLVAMLQEHDYLGKVLKDIDYVVPVPLSKKRLRARGYNQSMYLARALARALKRPVVLALARTRHTEAQSTLRGKARQLNVAEAFQLAKVRHWWGKKRVLKGCSILLVDDVVTTGATIKEAARTLKQAEVAQIRVVALARVPL